MDDLKIVFWKNTKDYIEWLNREFIIIFTFQKLPAKAVTLIVIVLGFFTVTHLAYPFNSNIANKLGLLGLFLLFFISGHSAYVSICLMLSLQKIVRKKANIPFFYLPFPPIRRLQILFSKSVLFVTLGYFLLAIAINKGPYQPSEVGFLNYILIMKVWLGVLAVFPLGMMIWFIVHNQKLIQNIKDSQIAYINKQIQIAYHTITCNQQKDNIENLEKLMDIQKKVRDIREWPGRHSIITYLHCNSNNNCNSNIYYLYKSKVKLFNTKQFLHSVEKNHHASICYNNHY